MSTWAARWRVALRIARRDALRHKGRTVLVVAMVALPLLAGTLLATVLRSSVAAPETRAQLELGDVAAARIQATGCYSGVIQSIDGRSSSCPGETGEALAPEDAIASELSGRDIVPAWEVNVAISTDEAAWRWPVREVDTDRVPGLVHLAAGSLPSEAGEIVLDASLADLLGGLGPGDHVSLTMDGVEQSAVVSGISTKFSGVYAGVGTLPLESVSPSWWYVTDSAPVTWAEVLGLNEHGLLVTSRAVLLDPPPAADVPFSELEEPDLTTLWFGIGIGTLVLLEVVLLVGPAFAVGARRQARHYAQVAAHGGAPADIRRMVLAHGVVTALGASVLGIALGLLGGIAVYLVMREGQSPLPNLILPTWELAGLLGLALLIGLVAAAVPARAASRADVVATLRGRRVEAIPSRGVPRLGVAVAALGALTALLGAISVHPVLLLAGVGALELGLVLSSGGAVALVARLAPALGVAGRFALREAARHRTRTGPAVAAVIAAVATASTLMIYVAGSDVAQQRTWQPVLPGPTVIVRLAEPLDPTAGAARLDGVVADVGADADLGLVLPVLGAADGSPATGDFHLLVDAQQDPATICPWDDLTDAERETDPRCQDMTFSSGAQLGAVVVDDGTLVGRIGLDSADDVARTLAAGGAMVGDARMIWPDGMAHLVVDDVDPETGEAQSSTATVTAVIAPPGWRLGLVVSPQAAATLGLEVTTLGALVLTDDPLDDAELARLAGAVHGVDPMAQVWRDEPYESTSDGVLRNSTLLAAVVALIATALATGLAGSHIAPDLATMFAVGASPRTRRRLVAAQALVIAGVGSLLGLVAGLVLGAVVVVWESTQGSWPQGFPFVVPWQLVALAIGVPVVAYLCGYLFSRSRLPLVRRLAE